MDTAPEQEYACKLLKEPLSVTDLISGGTKFEINTDFDDGISEEMFDDFNVGSDNDDDELNKKINDAALVSPWTESFDKLRSRMTQVNEHIYKTVVKSGKPSEPIVGDNMRVCIHYNAFWEGEGAPFDSTYLRGDGTKFYIGLGEVLEGIEGAVRTMRRGERSQFLISYKLLFHELGCPPRVKPRADGLYIIEVMSVDVVGNMDADRELSAEDRTKFSVVVEKVRDIHLKGLDFYKSGLYRNACRVFQKAVDVLNFCRLADEQEEREQSAFLLKLYTNLAVCYNKVKMPARTCLMCKEIRRLSHQKPSVKALFHEGRALLMLGEYKRARNVLAEAHSKEPHNLEINEEMRVLEKTYSEYIKHEKSMWTRAMGVLDLNDEADKKLPSEDQTPDEIFETQMAEVLHQFKDDVTKMNLHLPPGLTEKELDCVRKLTKAMELELSQLHTGDQSYVVQRI